MDTFALQYAAKNGWGLGMARPASAFTASPASAAVRRAASGDLSGADAIGGSGVGNGLHVLDEQCVSLAKAAVGASALDGSMKPGTPIATFLDRAGRASDRYAGGGTSTAGAHLDHAGVFQSHTRYEAGKLVGFRMA